MEQEFDNWNNLKKDLNTTNPLFENFPKRGEVWVVVLGKNIGSEQEGTGVNFSRPVLVIKKFNNQMFWCVPLSSKQKSFDFYLNFTDPDNNPVSAILAQLKLISIKRFDRKVYDFPWKLFDEIRFILKKLIG